jgi:hypothetical protein
MGIEIVGLSGFGFGVDWQKTESDKQIARRLITFLEDRRLLFGERHLEDEMHCVASALEIRAFLTEQIMAAKPGKELEGCLRVMRSATRRFVERGGPNAREYRDRAGGSADLFGIALGDLRTNFGYQLAVILSQYPQDIEDDLAKILPPGDEPQELDWLPGFDS